MAVADAASVGFKTSSLPISWEASFNFSLCFSYWYSARMAVLVLAHPAYSSTSTISLSTRGHRIAGDDEVSKLMQPIQNQLSHVHLQRPGCRAPTWNCIQF